MLRHSLPLVAFVIAAFIVAPNCWAQGLPSSPQPVSQPSAQSPNPANQNITIPAGTQVSLKLVSPITTKSRPGDAVRAVSAFPVTVGTQVAIPVGTYVEGVIQKVNKRRPAQMQFTRLVYANGYTVPINGEYLQARMVDERVVAPTVATASAPDAQAESAPAFEPAAAFTGDGEPNDAILAQQSPLPPLPQPQSHIGTVVGLAVAGAAALVVTAVIFHHRAGYDGVLFGTGWQFEMNLQEPISVDAANVAAALAVSNAQ